MVPRHSRSKNGCFTCRRRKKKCDEATYPICKSCEANRLECSWPEHVVELHKHAVADVTSEDIAASPEVAPAPSEVLHREERLYSPQPLSYRVSKPEKKGRSYFLERIAMQQDCVDDKEHEQVFDISELLADEPIVASRLGLEEAGARHMIRSRIAHQMDILGESFRKTP